MKFFITKSRDDKEQPHPKAKLETFHGSRDYRTTPTLEEAKTKQWFDEWFKRGTNHREDLEMREYLEMVVCDLDDTFEAWTVEIENFDDLVSFIPIFGDYAVRPTNIERVHILPLTIYIDGSDC